MTPSVTILTWLVSTAAAQSDAPRTLDQGIQIGEDIHIQPTARVHLWGTLYDMDDDPQADPASYGDPEADIGFAVRRARIGLSGNARGAFWRVSMGTGSPYDALSSDEPLIQIVDAYGGYAWGEDQDTTLAAGIVSVPYNRETLMSSLDLLFQERGVGSVWTSPIRDVGVIFDTTQGLFRGRVGVYNGNGDFRGDNNDGVMAVARVELSSGETYRTYAPNGDTAWGVALSALYNDGLATQTLGLNADAFVHVGPISAMAGLTRNDIQPNGELVTSPDVFNGTEQIGFTAQLSATVPLNTGGLEIGSRYSSFDDATALKDNGDVSIVHTGLTWRDIAPGVDLGAGYVLRLERQGRSLPNDTVRIWTQFRFPMNDREG